MKFSLSFLLIYLLVSCNKTEKTKLDSSKVIISAKILNFEELSFHQVKKMEYGCYCYPYNWRDGVEFKKENAFYVKVKLNNKILAELSESKTFSKEYLLSKDYTLYGKYHNRWEFRDSLDNKICETEKFEGFQILDLDRNGEIDEITIGPIISKPKKIIINISDSKYYPDNEAPEFKL